MVVIIILSIILHYIFLVDTLNFQFGTINIQFQIQQ